MNQISNSFKHISKHIEPNSRVLDLGCGTGSLLDMLKKKKNIQGYGIEIQFNHILSCIEKGISVFQTDINEGLAEISDNAYDYVILSQTIQQVKNPKLVLSEMLRVGKQGIVLFPNFAYWKIRLQLLFGQTPKTKTLPYSWDNTPNIRVVTVIEFKKLCDKLNISIVKELNPDSTIMPNFLLPNLFYKKGMYIIEKKK
ncbi:methionine biosynthesis protein MetW [bacterium]|jgi:methionine biosynthesis protein MetW|nr:methionine biosynthesis protein MetW [bacterium]